MCLSVVGKIEKIEHDIACMNIAGVKKWICIDFIENPKVGEELLIHAGCAISKLNHVEADEIKDALNEFEKGNVVYYGRDD